MRARGFGPEGEGLAVFSERHCWNDDPISLDDGRIRQPGGIELDLSAIAKGHGQRSPLLRCLWLQPLSHYCSGSQWN